MPLYDCTYVCTNQKCKHSYLGCSESISGSLPVARICQKCGARMSCRPAMHDGQLPGRAGKR